jgi:hypothetical protein
MPGYDAYLIGRDGHIKDRHVIVCDDEEEAKRRAKQLVDGHAVELWEQVARSNGSNRSTDGRLPAYFSSWSLPRGRLRTRLSQP